MNLIGESGHFRKNWTGERKTWSICTVPIHENEKQALIIWIEIHNVSIEEVQKLVENWKFNCLSARLTNLEVSERPL